MPINNQQAIKLMPFIFVMIWSVGAIFIKIGLSFTDPFLFLLLRLVIASIVMLILALLANAPWPRNGKLLSKIIFTGLILQFCYQATFSYTIYLNVSPAILTIILGLQPILTTIISAFILKNPIFGIQWIGLKLGLLGVLFVVVGDLSMDQIAPIGIVFSFLCLLSTTIGSLLQKNLTEMNLLTGSTIQLSVSIIPAFMLTLFFSKFLININPLFMISISWVSLMVSVGATYIYYTLLKNKHIISITNLFYLVPPVTAILCYIIFNEPLHTNTIIGIVLVVLAIMLGNMNNNLKKALLSRKSGLFLKKVRGRL